MKLTKVEAIVDMNLDAQVKFEGTIHVHELQDLLALSMVTPGEGYKTVGKELLNQIDDLLDIKKH